MRKVDFRKFSALEKICGKISSIRYYNENNGYMIASCIIKVGKKKRQYVVKGNLPGAKKMMTFEAEGEWITDRIYGEEFEASKITETVPDDAEGIKAYLSSGIIKGIGEKTAEIIVKAFGAETLNVIDNEPEKLLELKGISQKTMENIVSQMKENKALRDIMVFLKTYGISNNFAGKIYHAYGEDTIKILTEDPYRLAEDIEGIGFKKADEIALKMGTDIFGDRRISVGVKYVLIKASEDKDTFLPTDALIKTASSANILDVHPVLVEKRIKSMTSEAELIDDVGKIYLPANYKLECAIADILAKKAKNDMFDAVLSSDDIVTDGIEYSDEQLDAIDLALRSKITVITGGPGVGKTTILNGLLSIFRRNSYKVLLAAPTGRAAKRMNESTHMEAKTIHRLLEYSDGSFKKNASDKLKGDVLILDECSMINLSLMYSLLSAIPNRMKLIMVGDVDQLPSIGCGTILKDIIDSRVVPVARLTKIFRQGKESRIITNAYAINQGEMPNLKNDSKGDFYFFRVYDKGMLQKQVVRLVTEAIPHKFGINKEDIQVLTPMRKAEDAIGSISLNQTLQERINPNGEYVSTPLYKLRIGDRVMQTKNNYDLEAYNGDIGIIDSIDKDEGIVKVKFFGNSYSTIYEKGDIEQLELAYATTIHKSQGSEYPAVVIIVDRSHYIMLQKQLLYTAVTRAKKLCVIIGTEDAVRLAVTTKPKDMRRSWLSQRLQDASAHLDYEEG